MSERHERTNSNDNVDIEVEDMIIVASRKKRGNYLEENIVAYTEPELKMCDKPFCKGHYKYGVFDVEHKNIPVVFFHHEVRGNKIWYVDFTHKSMLNVKIPSIGQTLIPGVHWNTLTPLDRQKFKFGLRNSCMIDGWIVDMRLRSLDARYCFACWFLDKLGPGAELEKKIRTMCNHMLFFTHVKMDEKGENLIAKALSLSHDQDLKVKTIWLGEDLENIPDTEEFLARSANGRRRERKIKDLVTDDLVVTNPLNHADVLKTQLMPHK